MKKQNYLFIVLALVSSLFIGCADHNDDDTEEHAHTKVTDSHESNADWQPELARSHDDNENGHHHTPHMGLIVPFRSGQSKAGFIELKLHDDKGDLELWLTKDKAGITPFDLPLDSRVTASFPQLAGKTVTLQVRNDTQNEDEDGKGNIRDRKTNYFIFPGDTKADASFLLGKSFSADVVVSFTSGAIDYETSPFKLAPHSH